MRAPARRESIERDESWSPQFGHANVSGICAAGRITAQYSTDTLARAGIQRYVGTPKSRPRSIIWRRVSGNGDTPNSMPRVSPVPFQGEDARLAFSSQMPSQGKSLRFQM